VSELETPEPVVRPEAIVPWGDLLPDVLLLFVGLLAMVLSFVLDACLSKPNYFPRSGAIAALVSGIVAFWSINKHYRKFFNYSDLAEVPSTSLNQRRVDRFTLFLSIVGTLVWAYGDIIFQKLWGDV